MSLGHLILRLGILIDSKTSITENNNIKIKNLIYIFKKIFNKILTLVFTCLRDQTAPFALSFV
jgi:hypothetical protein